MANVSSSNLSLAGAFGGIPQQLARYLTGSQLGPLLRGLGFGGGRHAGQFEKQLANATGPLAEFIRQVRGFSPSVIPQAQEVGNVAANAGQQSYQSLMGQINNSLGAANQG